MSLRYNKSLSTQENCGSNGKNEAKNGLENPWVFTTNAWQSHWYGRGRIEWDILEETKKTN